MMRSFRFAYSFVMMALATPLAAQPSLAEMMVPNVASIRAGNATGFGFIVGLGARELVVATALHTLQVSAIDTPTICFPLHGETCARGRLISIADAVGNQPALDLAFLTVPYPDGLPWRPDVLAASFAAGTEVRSIGRALEWYVPDQPGRVVGRDAATRTVRYQGLTVAEGVSGAPIVSAEGIVAMHTQSLGGEEGAFGIDIAAVRERLTEQARRHWILVEQPDCSTHDAHRGALAGRDIVMHFDASSPDGAMQAVARLNCLGARVLLEPAWDSGSWPGESITYRSGDLRIGRTIQTILASFGRIDTQLGQPAGDIEIWMR